MRAAVIQEVGAAPVVVDRPLPESDGRAVVELAASALNPVDLTIAAGRFPAGHPELPYVPGVEAVGRVVRSERFAVGTRVYASGGGLGVAVDGALAETFAVSDAALIAIPDGADDEQSVAFGTAGLAAWLPLTWAVPVGEGDTVLVLGSTGAVGTIAVQAARLLGASRVVAVGRDPERLRRNEEHGADAAVAISDGLADDLRSACGDAAPNVIIDCLWGQPLEAALAVAARGATIVHVGQSAGPTATIASGLVRGKQLRILGYSNFAVPPERLAAGYGELMGHVRAGAIELETESVRLEDVPEAWRRLTGGERTKFVVVP